MAKYMNLWHIFYVGFAFCHIECFVIFVENGMAILYLYRLISTPLEKNSVTTFPKDVTLSQI